MMAGLFICSLGVRRSKAVRTRRNTRAWRMRWSNTDPRAGPHGGWTKRRGV